MTDRILLVDDDTDILLLGRRCLEAAGHEVHEAEGGRHGLNEARRLRPDLVVTDVQMPGLDGWELVRRMRREPELALVPVVFLTGRQRTEDRLRGFRLGADAYLTKPIDLEEFQVVVGNVLERSRAQRVAVHEQLDEGRGPGLHGELSELGLGSVLSLLELERKTGRLELTGAGAGRVWLREGSVIAIRRTDGGPGEHRTGVEALSTMMTWRRGQFAFHAGPVQADDEVQLSTTALLLDASRVLDEREAALSVSD